MTFQLIPATCPVCGNTVAAPFYNAGAHTLATLGWPDSAASAQAMPRHPLDFVQCPQCTHVWNRKFSYDAIPYEKNPNRMFNTGGIWKGHLAATRDLVLDHLPEAPVVVEVGCGEGHFIRGLAEASQSGRFIGFDPNGSAETGLGVEFYPRLFAPLDDMADYAPDAVVIRHVIEHLTEPAALLEQLAWGAAQLTKPCWLFVEVPCIDRVFLTDRLADFFYEHVSHFTSASFRTLMARAGEVITMKRGYDGEVVYALVRLGVPSNVQQQAADASAFAKRTTNSCQTIRTQLGELVASGKRVVIWGGTGKAAAFIHYFGADAERFPLVVDSDIAKTGSYVPGSGQRIVYRDVLKGIPVDVVIIPTQWRSRDITAEMEREGIAAGLVLIEHGGRLVDFWHGDHPY